LEGPRNPRKALEVLRESGVRHIDLVVAARGNRSDATVVRSLYDRFGPVPVAAPAMHRVPGAHAVIDGESARLTGLQIEFFEAEKGLSVRVGPAVGPETTARGVPGGG